MANLLPSFSFSLIPLDHHHNHGTKCSFFHTPFIQIKHQHQLVGKNLQDLIISPFSHNLTSKLCATSRLSVEETEQKFSTFTQSEDIKTALSYLFRTEIGEGLVKVYVKKKKVTYFVYIEVSSLELVRAEGETLVLCWGVYRDDSLSVNVGKGMNVSPFVQNSLGKFSVELEFDVEQVPFYLSFLLRYSGLEIRTHMKRNFCVPVGFYKGCPSLLGLSFSPDESVNFAVFSRRAESVVLCLYDDDNDSVEKPALELDLDPYVNRSGDIWHISFESVGNFVRYGYRLGGAHRDNSYAECVVLDPYARIVGNSFPNGIGSVKNLGFLKKDPAFDWGDDYHLNLDMEKLLVYRLNVKRFTEHESSQLPGDLAGTFSGLAKKVQHFKDLGMNAVLLEPVFTFDEEKGPYFPCNFFSPMNLYGKSGDPVSTINSMKDMVKTMHANGIEVLMEVVFSNTAETGALHGIDDLSYYYANGVGGLKVQSALNCNYPIMQNLILDSLRYWVTEFHIDGFSFVNASHLLRGFHGEYLSRPPLVEAIAFDPILWKTKIIADCWDLNAMEAKEIRFPHWMRWAEINTNFCNDVRNFLRGENLLSNLATRLCGSGDMYSCGRGPAFSFNYIARNFGLSLVDLVSFSSADLDVELSWNCGEEGPTNNTAVLERRLKQIRNFLFILFVSLGVPVLNMGDECGYSSGGSPAYGDTKPFNWAALKTGFGKQTTQFISFLTSLRKRRSDLLQSKSFLKEENIEWRGVDNAPPRWEDPSCKFLAMNLKAEKGELQESSVSSDILGDLFIVFNADDHPETVVLPLLPEGVSWYRLVDTALPFPGFFLTNGDFVPEQISGLCTYEMKSYSCTLFEANNSTS
ncbi:isoamylase 2, chloroplastic [Cicer arietinum]|uniref:Isoamylase 2, chloroplastic n=1 Tax=Cicer arietinum TaxID=3827 RepID=A0A1S2XS14_CICAR|nr:isoamylase 2, chloroplastic [Cicer arietinum]